MANLRQPVKKVLINTPGPDNLGTYIETNGSGNRILQFKHHGYSLPATGGEQVRIMLPQPHTHRVSLFTISDVAPIDPLNYEYGITIHRRVRKPGVDNSKFFPEQKYYGGKLPSVDPGQISDAQLNTMRDSIIQQINDDLGYTQRPEYQMPGAAVVASRILYLDNWADDVGITLDDTNDIPARANIGLWVDEINAIDGYFAWNISDTEVYVIKTSRNNNPSTPIATSDIVQGITVEDEPDNLIALTNRYEDATFEVKFKPTFGTNQIVRNGNFALLTNDEVQQVFSHIPNDGGLAQERRHPNLVLPDTDYVKLMISVPQEHYDLGGASHGVFFITEVELYIPVAEYAANATNRWELIDAGRAMDAGGDTNFRDIMDEWSGGIAWV